MIVDNLRVYKQPVFVYLPPGCELRGGAWVVVDPTINKEMMEMYADPTSRGGVLEPEGIVSIKFRRKTKEQAMLRLGWSLAQSVCTCVCVSTADFLFLCLAMYFGVALTAHTHTHSLSPSRADAEYKRLHARANDTTLSAEEQEEAKNQLEARYQLLEGVYHQVAVQFADLHDTPGRMKHKHCIRSVVEWAHARKFFFWRLRRRLGKLCVCDEEGGGPIIETKMHTRTHTHTHTLSLSLSLSLSCASRAPGGPQD